MTLHQVLEEQLSAAMAEGERAFNAVSELQRRVLAQETESVELTAELRKTRKALALAESNSRASKESREVRSNVNHRSCHIPGYFTLYITPLSVMRLSIWIFSSREGPYTYTVE